MVRKKAVITHLPAQNVSIKGITDSETYAGDAQFPPDAWASLNAFAVGLTAASVSNFESYIGWLLRHTLPAAATWVLYAGRLLYHIAAKEQGRSSETHPLHVHFLRKSEKRYSNERWISWEERSE